MFSLETAELPQVSAWMLAQRSAENQRGKNYDKVTLTRHSMFWVPPNNKWQQPNKNPAEAGSIKMRISFSSSAELFLSSYYPHSANSQHIRKGKRIIALLCLMYLTRYISGNFLVFYGRNKGIHFSSHFTFFAGSQTEVVSLRTIICKCPFPLFSRRRFTYIRRLEGAVKAEDVVL